MHSVQQEECFVFFASRVNLDLSASLVHLGRVVPLGLWVHLESTALLVKLVVM